MKKLGIVVATALLAFVAIGCSNASGGFDAKDSSGKAKIFVAVDKSSARTALPTNPVTDDFTCLTLTGVLGDSSTSVTLSPDGGWVASDSKTAYDVMAADSIELDVGSWSFTLTATIAGTSGESTVYTGSTTATLASGSNVHLSFPLSIQSVGEEGEGSIVITLAFDDAVSEDEVASVAVSIATTDGDAVATTVTAPEDALTGAYTIADIGVGNYVVTFALKNEAGNVIARLPEYAIVRAGKASASTVTFYGVNATYAITYCDASSNNEALTGLTPATYTLLDTITLPVPAKTGYTFCGWYGTSADASVDATATAVTTIAEGTAGALTYYAKFIADTEIASVESVTIDGTIKVGETVSAKAWTDSNATEAFSGTVYAYTWLKAAASDGTYSTIDGATGATYTVQATDAGSYLQVQVRQKYTATDSDGDGVYTLSLASDDDTSVNPAVASAVLTTAVQKGTLDASTLVLLDEDGEALTMLTYNGNTAVASSVVLSDDRLNTTVGSATCTVTNSASTASSVSVTLSLAAPSATASVTAPETYSAFYSVWLSADGYNSVQFERESGATDAGIGEVYVMVKAATPASTDSGYPTLSTDVDQITSGKVCFTNASTNSAYQYIVSADTPSASDTSWKIIPYASSSSTAQFYADNPIEVASGSTLYIRAAATGTVYGDDYIAPSDAVSVTVAEENIGELETLSTLTATFNDAFSLGSNTTAVATGTASVTVGYTLTMAATDTANEDKTDDSSVAYQWYRVTPPSDITGWTLPSESEVSDTASTEAWTAITDATENAYTLTADDEGAYVRVTATQTVGSGDDVVTYPVHWVTGSVVGTGTLVAASSYYLVYRDTNTVLTDSNAYATLGASLDASCVDVSKTSPATELVSACASAATTADATTLAAVNAVTGAAVTVSFAFTETADDDVTTAATGYYGSTTASADTVVPNGSGYVAVIASADGYRPLAMDVAIDVKGVQPEATEDYLKSWLSRDVTNITYGHILFLAAADTDGVYWCATNATSDSAWTRVSPTEFNYLANSTLYLRIGLHASSESQPSLAGETRSNDKNIYKSSATEVTAVAYSSTFTGTRSVVLSNLTFSNHEIEATISDNVLTAQTTDSNDTIVAWYIDDTLISVSGGVGTYTVNDETVATLDWEAQTLTFADAGTRDYGGTLYYNVTIEGLRNGTIPLTTTATVKVVVAAATDN